MVIVNNFLLINYNYGNKKLSQMFSFHINVPHLYAVFFAGPDESQS